MFWDWLDQFPSRQNDDGVRVKLNCEGLEDRCNPADITSPNMFVTTATDVMNDFDGVVSLREAVKWSNEHLPGAGDRNVIEFAAALKNIPITLQGGMGKGRLTVEGTTLIRGIDRSYHTVTRDASTGTFGLFRVAAGATVTFEKLTLRGGAGANGEGGGAILSDGNLTVVTCDVRDNAAPAAAGGTGGFGGGIKGSFGSITITGMSAVAGNQAVWGGGVYAAAGVPLHISHSAVAINTATTYGGGIYAAGPTATLDNTQVAGNTAADAGGGIYTSGATLTLQGSSQIFDNTTGGKGGGVYVGGGKIVYAGVLIGDNKAAAGQGDGVYRAGAAREGNGVGWKNDVEVVGP